MEHGGERNLQLAKWRKGRSWEGRKWGLRGWVIIMGGTLGRGPLMGINEGLRRQHTTDSQATETEPATEPGLTAEGKGQTKHHPCRPTAS